MQVKTDTSKRGIWESIKAMFSFDGKLFDTQFIQQWWYRNVSSIFSNRVGIDLGTAITIAYLDGRGVVLNEPTLLTINKRTAQIGAIGKEARQMLGRTPEHVEVVQPLKDGVIADYEVAEQLFSYIFRKINSIAPKLINPTVIIGVPCAVREVEANSVRSAVLDAGAREVHLIAEPIAAAIGADLQIFSKFGKSTMIVDIGGGTSDVMVISRGEIIMEESIKIAGDAFNEILIKTLAKTKNIKVGLRTAEDLKIATMQTSQDKNNKFFVVRGQDAKTGLPKEVKVTLADVIEYLSPLLDQVVERIKEVVEKLSSEIIADLKKQGIYFVGGGTLIQTFADRLHDSLNLKITIPKDPVTIVARGTAIIAKNPKKYSYYFLK